MKYIYNTILSPIDESGRYVARVPDLPGCVTTGKDLSDAVDMIIDAASLWLVVAEDEHLSIAEPTPQAEMPHEAKDIVTLIQLDTTAYRKATDSRAVRKNVSLPAWMARKADENGLNCSQILQEVLSMKFKLL